MKITKIRQTDAGIEIEHEQHTGKNGVNHITLNSKDEPKSSFAETMQKLKKVFQDICVMTPEYAADFVIRGVAFKYNPAGNKSVIISAMRPMEIGTPLNISAPSRMVDSKDEDAKTQLEDEYVLLLNAMEKEATDYVNGERSEKQDQMNLDDSENSESSEE